VRARLVGGAALLCIAALAAGASACRQGGEASAARAESEDAGGTAARAGREGRAAGASAADAPREGLELIDQRDLRSRLVFFASDFFEGRQAGTRGADLAAAYLASELAALGLAAPGPDSSYIQRFRMPSFGPPGTFRDSTQNVIGVVPGSDPAFAGEYVAIGAHYDHVGVGVPVEGDSIYNGADDDGSGTVALLEVAEALVRGPRPKRSVIFVFHGAEEAGLLGSFFFTLQPLVPRDSIVAQLNVDMVGRNAPDSLSVIGAGRISSELDDVVRRQGQAAALHLDYTFDAPDHPERLYYRSDHYNYAQYGIPVVFFFSGLHPDYHQPSDEVDKIDFGKVERAAELVYRVAWEVANRPERLARDRLQQ
jgi:hypothetical protein